jgi:hypothetical protein
MSSGYSNPQYSIVRHDASRTAVVQLPHDLAESESTWTHWSWLPSFPVGFFCAAPTILEAINGILESRGMPTLYVQADGTIGPTNPLLLHVEYTATPPFVH